jgi:hypothetical protein
MPSSFDADISESSQNVSPDAQFQGVAFLTTDGGKTWTQYNELRNFYFMQISTVCMYLLYLATHTHTHTHTLSLSLSLVASSNLMSLCIIYSLVQCVCQRYHLSWSFEPCIIQVVSQAPRLFSTTLTNVLATSTTTTAAMMVVVVAVANSCECYNK